MVVRSQSLVFLGFVSMGFPAALNFKSSHGLSVKPKLAIGGDQSDNQHEHSDIVHNSLVVQATQRQTRGAIRREDEQLKLVLKKSLQLEASADVRIRKTSAMAATKNEANSPQLQTGDKLSGSADKNLNNRGSVTIPGSTHGSTDPHGSTTPRVSNGFSVLIPPNDTSGSSLDTSHLQFPQYRPQDLLAGVMEYKSESSDAERGMECKSECARSGQQRNSEKPSGLGSELGLTEGELAEEEKLNLKETPTLEEHNKGAAGNGQRIAEMHDEGLGLRNVEEEAGKQKNMDEGEDADEKEDPQEIPADAQTIHKQYIKELKLHENARREAVEWQYLGPGSESGSSLRKSHDNYRTAMSKFKEYVQHVKEYDTEPLLFENSPISGYNDFGLWDASGNKCATGKHIYWVKRPENLRHELMEDSSFESRGSSNDSAICDEDCDVNFSQFDHSESSGGWFQLHQPVPDRSEMPKQLGGEISKITWIKEPSWDHFPEVLNRDVNAGIDNIRNLTEHVFEIDTLKFADDELKCQLKGHEIIEKGKRLARSLGWKWVKVSNASFWPVQETRKGLHGVPGRMDGKLLFVGTIFGDYYTRVEKFYGEMRSYEGFRHQLELLKRNVAYQVESSDANSSSASKNVIAGAFDREAFTRKNLKAYNDQGWIVNPFYSNSERNAEAQIQSTEIALDFSDPFASATKSSGGVSNTSSQSSPTLEELQTRLLAVAAVNQLDRTLFATEAGRPGSTITLEVEHNNSRSNSSLKVGKITLRNTPTGTQALKNPDGVVPEQGDNDRLESGIRFKLDLAQKEWSGPADDPGNYFESNGVPMRTLLDSYCKIRYKKKASKVLEFEVSGGEGSENETRKAGRFLVVPRECNEDIDIDAVVGPRKNGSLVGKAEGLIQGLLSGRNARELYKLVVVEWRRFQKKVSARDFVREWEEKWDEKMTQKKKKGGKRSGGKQPDAPAKAPASRPTCDEILKGKLRNGTVLEQDSEFQTQAAKDEAVAKLRVFTHEMLYDFAKRVWMKIMQSGQNVGSDITKVSHGKETSAVGSFYPNLKKVLENLKMFDAEDRVSQKNAGSRLADLDLLTLDGDSIHADPEAGGFRFEPTFKLASEKDQQKQELISPEKKFLFHLWMSVIGTIYTNEIYYPMKVSSAEVERKEERRAKVEIAERREVLEVEKPREVVEEKLNVESRSPHAVLQDVPHKEDRFQISKSHEESSMIPADNNDICDPHGGAHPEHISPQQVTGKDGSCLAQQNHTEEADRVDVKKEADEVPERKEVEKNAQQQAEEDSLRLKMNRLYLRCNADPQRKDAHKEEWDLLKKVGGHFGWTTYHQKKETRETKIGGLGQMKTLDNPRKRTVNQNDGRVKKGSWDSAKTERAKQFVVLLENADKARENRAESVLVGVRRLLEDFKGLETGLAKTEQEQVAVQGGQQAAKQESEGQNPTHARKMGNPVLQNNSVVISGVGRGNEQAAKPENQSERVADLQCQQAKMQSKSVRKKSHIFPEPMDETDKNVEKTAGSLEQQRTEKRPMDMTAEEKKEHAKALRKALAEKRKKENPEEYASFMRRRADAEKHRRDLLRERKQPPGPMEKRAKKPMKISALENILQQFSDSEEEESAQQQNVQQQSDENEESAEQQQSEDNKESALQQFQDDDNRSAHRREEALEAQDSDKRSKKASSDSTFTPKHGDGASTGVGYVSGPTEHMGIADLIGLNPNDKSCEKSNEECNEECNEEGSPESSSDASVDRSSNESPNEEASGESVEENPFEHSEEENPFEESKEKEQGAHSARTESLGKWGISEVEPQEAPEAEKKGKSMKQKKEYTCPTCGKAFSQSCNLKRHIAEKICLKNPKLNQGLEESQGHPEGLHPEGHQFSTKPAKKVHTCPACSKTFSQKSNLNRHLAQTSCGKPKDAPDHVQGQPAHPSQANARYGQGTFRCETCQAIFGSKANLQRHKDNNRCFTNFRSLDTRKTCEFCKIKSPECILDTFSVVLVLNPIDINTANSS